VAHYNYNNNSDADADDEPECANNSDARDDPRSDDDILFDFKDNRSDDGAADEDIDGHGCLNSGYSSDVTNVIITKDIDKCYTTELDKCGQPL